MFDGTKVIKIILFAKILERRVLLLLLFNKKTSLFVKRSVVSLKFFFELTPYGGF